jgi:ketosteroid isomerase-like protein
MKTVVLFLIGCFMLSACNFFKQKNDNANADTQPNVVAVLNADKAFSKLSDEVGIKNAYIQFIDSNGVMLRPNAVPITGADAIDFLSQLNDSSYTLTWQAKKAVVAASGDLGYTYGIYALQPKAADTLIYGTYVTIWKKQADGTWKFVLDSANEGVGDAVE